MNPGTQKDAIRLFSATAKIPHSKNVDVVVCPPFVYLESLSHISASAQGGPALGGQDVFWENPSGAYTGEVSAAMLKSFGVEYVIIGHSERRRLLGETDAVINKKVLTALAAGLKIILCVGEPSEHGLTQTAHGLTRNTKLAKKSVANQLKKDLAGIRSAPNSIFHIPNSSLTIAYEPIWAIGTGIPDKPEDSNSMAVFIKSFLNSKFQIPNSRVLYGGSVNAKNAAAFLDQPKIDGALVGGASLDAKNFKKIIEAAQNKK